MAEVRRVFGMPGGDQSDQRPLIEVEVSICKRDADTYNAKGESLPLPRRVVCVVDTGANRSCLLPEILESIGALSKYDGTLSGTSSTDHVQSIQHMICMRLFGPEGPITFDPLQVASVANVSPGAVGLVGMDIIQHAVLTVDGPNKRWVLAFGQ